MGNRADLQTARWRRLRRHILARDSWRCQACGKLLGRAEVDHIKPVVKGGANILNPRLDERPPVRAENDQREFSAPDILLVWHVPVRSNHDFIPCFFRPV